MAVYREGYTALELILSQTVRIYNDACDTGVPTKQGDAIWNAAKQLVKWYGDKNTRSEERYSTGRSCKSDFTLIDERAVSDERKTIEEATERYSIEFVSCTDGKCKGYDGYIFVWKK